MATPGRKGHARVAVLTPISEEFVALQSAVGATQSIRGTGYFTPPGNPRRPDVVVKEAGRANLSATYATRDTLEDWQPQFVILCGIAGGISGRDGVEKGDIILPHYVHYCSFSKLTLKSEQRRYVAYDPPSPHLHKNYAVPMSHESQWLDDIDPAIPDTNISPKILIGALIGGDKVYGDPKSTEQKRIVKGFTDALAIDMESVGLCSAVSQARSHTLYNPQLLIVRAISDLVDDQANSTTRDLWKEYAAASAAAFVKALVRGLLESEADTR